MSVYIPNSGEKEALKSILMNQGIVLGLYKNQVTADGNLTIDALEEMPQGGSYGYASIPLVNQVLESAIPVADKWAVGLNASGQAQAQYDTSEQLWTFLAADVADGLTVYGVFGYTIVLPFTAGLAAFPTNVVVGATVTGNGGATGVVTGYHVQSGSFAAGPPGTAAGWIYIKTRNATSFINGEALKVGGTTVATVNIAGYTDAPKKLIFVEALTTPTQITQLGQQIGYTPVLAMGSM